MELENCNKPKCQKCGSYIPFGYICYLCGNDYEKFITYSNSELEIAKKENPGHYKRFMEINKRYSDTLVAKIDGVFVHLLANGP